MRGLPLLVLLVAAAAEAGPSVRAEPDFVYAGTRAPVVLTVAGKEPVRAFAGTGTLRELGVAGDTRRFEWVPPEGKSPSTGVIVFLRDDPLDPTVVNVPLWGRTDLEIDTEPGAQVRVLLGGRAFGPRKASAQGKVVVPVDVPPEGGEAQVLAESSGTSTEQKIPIAIPKSAAVATGFARQALVRGEDAYLLVASAAPIAPESLTLESSSGSPVLVRSRPDLLVYKLPAPAVGEQLSVRLRGDGGKLEVGTAEAPLVEATSEAAAAGAVPPSPFSLRLQVEGGPVAYVGTDGVLGPELRLAAGLGWSLFGGRFVIGIEPGLRVSSFARSAADGSTIHATFYAATIEPTARLRVFSKGPFALRAWASAGVLPSVHLIQTGTQAPRSETLLGISATAGVEAAWSLRELELFGTLGGGVERASTASFVVPKGRAALRFGFRYRFP